MSLALISHPDCLLHDTGDGHPENAGRLKAILARLESSDLWPRLVHCEAPLAPWSAIERAHDSQYLKQIQGLFPLRRPKYLDGDTRISEFSLEAALRAAGACIHGVDLVMADAVESAFCAIRPPGHHACHAGAMGFCVFNNIAVAALHALHAYRLNRVLVLDFDVHHGNGTQDILANHPKILMCGSFQEAFYPFSGGLDGPGNMLNCPLPKGSSREHLRRTMAEHWIDSIDAFEPQLILVSAGFDAHQDDPLAGLNWTTEDYAWLGQFVRRVAQEYCGGRSVSSLEGGYDPYALSASVEAYLRGLANEEVHPL